MGESGEYVRNILDRSGEEPVSAEQIKAALEAFRAQLIAAYRRKLDKLAPLTPPEASSAEEALDKAYQKISILSDGLAPSDDYRVLNKQIEFWGGLATTIEYSGEDVARATELLEQAVNGVQGMMFANRLITDEAKAQLQGRWSPPAEQPEAN